MTPSFRSKKAARETPQIVSAEGIWGVESQSFPDFPHGDTPGQGGCIYLQGDESNRDNRIVAREFKDNAQRDEFFNNIQKALIRWANNTDKWKGVDRSVPIKEPTLEEVRAIPGGGRCFELHMDMKKR